MRPFKVIWVSSLLLLGSVSRAESQNLVHRYGQGVGVAVRDDRGAELAHEWDPSQQSTLNEAGYAARAGVVPLRWPIFNDRAYDNAVPRALSSSQSLALYPPNRSGGFTAVTFALDYLPALAAGQAWVLRTNVALRPRANDAAFGEGAKLEVVLSQGSHWRSLYVGEVSQTAVPIFLPLGLGAPGAGSALTFKVTALDPARRLQLIFDYPTLDALSVFPLTAVTASRVSATDSSNLGAMPDGEPAPPWRTGFYAFSSSPPPLSVARFSVAPPDTAGEDAYLQFPLGNLSRANEYRLVGRFRLEDRSNRRARVRVMAALEGAESITSKFFQEPIFDTYAESNGPLQVLDAPVGVLNRLNNFRFRLRLRRAAGASPDTKITFEDLAVVAVGPAKNVGLQYHPHWGTWQGEGISLLQLAANLFASRNPPAAPTAPFDAKGGIIRIVAGWSKDAEVIADAIAKMKEYNFRVLLVAAPAQEDFVPDARGFLPYNPANDYFDNAHLYRYAEFGTAKCVAQNGTVSDAVETLVCPHWCHPVGNECRKNSNQQICENAGQVNHSCPAGLDLVTEDCLKCADSSCSVQVAQRLPFPVFAEDGVCKVAFTPVLHPDAGTNPEMAAVGTCQVNGVPDSHAVFSGGCRQANRVARDGACHFINPDGSYRLDPNSTFQPLECKSRYEKNASFPRKQPGLSKINQTKFFQRIKKHVEEVGKRGATIDFLEVGNELNSAGFNDDFDISRAWDDTRDAAALTATALSYRQMLKNMRWLVSSSNEPAVRGAKLILGGPAFYNRTHYAENPDANAEQKQGGKVPGWLFIRRLRIDPGSNVDQISGLVDAVGMHLYPPIDQLELGREMIEKYRGVVGRQMPLIVSESGQHLGGYAIPAPLPGFKAAPYWGNVPPLDTRPFQFVRMLQAFFNNRYGDVPVAVLWDLDNCQKAGLLSAWRVDDPQKVECVQLPLPIPGSPPYLPDAKVLGVYGP